MSALLFISKGDIPLKEVTNQTLSERVSPDSIEKVIEIYDKKLKLIESGSSEGWEPIEFEIQQPRKDGAIIWTTNTVRPVQGMDKQPAGIVGTTQDVTERKLAEASLESEERFRELFEEAPLAYQALDQSGNFIDVNQTWLSTMGYSKGDVIGKNFSEFLHPDCTDHFRENFPRFKAIGEVLGTEFTMQKKDGTKILVSFRGKIAKDKTGQFKQTHCVFHDITDERKNAEDRKRLEEQLRQAQKMESVGRLAGGVAHDYNNILSVILGYTEMALGKVDPKDPLHADLEEILIAAKRSTDYPPTSAFARKQTIAPKVLDLNAAPSRHAQDAAAPDRRGHRSGLAAGADLWPVKMDPSQVDQILANLCVNARDAIGGVGKITIETEHTVFDEAYCADHPGAVPGDYTRLTVTDDGCGMDEETLEHIFEPFFTTKGVGEGHRPGAGHRVRHRQAERRLHQRLQRARPRHDVQDLPATVFTCS